jgi:hypothetical protein
MAACKQNKLNSNGIQQNLILKREHTFWKTIATGKCLSSEKTKQYKFIQPSDRKESLLQDNITSTIL